MFTDGRTDVRTDDARQAHRYIPRTFRSGDKNKAFYYKRNNINPFRANKQQIKCQTKIAADDTLMILLLSFEENKP